MYYLILQQVADATNASAQTAQPAAWIQPVMIIAMFAVLYFLIIRPQNKKQKEHKQMLEALKINDKVITTGGIIGKIVNFKKEQDTVLVRIDENTNTKIEVKFSAIAGKVNEK